MNRHRISLTLAAAIALLALWSLTSCSGSSNPTNSGGSGGTGMPTATNTVSISGLAFSPASITIKVGVKVTWTNKDGATHTVTSDDETFTSSGNLATNETYEFTFTTAGTYPYHCAIHPAMKGTVTVTP